MSTEHKKKLVNILSGFEGFQSYSGRAMYGTKCVGIVCEKPMATLVEIFGAILESESVCEANVSEDGEETTGGGLEEAWELKNALGYPQWDNMGMDYILYFPELNPALADSENEDSDDDEEE